MEAVTQKQLSNNSPKRYNSPSSKHYRSVTQKLLDWLLNNCMYVVIAEKHYRSITQKLLDQFFKNFLGQLLKSFKTRGLKAFPDDYSKAFKTGYSKDDAIHVGRCTLQFSLWADQSFFWCSLQTNKVLNKNRTGCKRGSVVLLCYCRLQEALNTVSEIILIKSHVFYLNQQSCILKNNLIYDIFLTWYSRIHVYSPSRQL